MGSINLRKATLKNLKEVKHLSTELAYSDIPFDKDIDLNWANTEDGEKYYKEKIEKGLCTVVEVNDFIIGYSTYAIKDVPSWRMVKVAELENLFVTEKSRSKGVGQLLMDDFVEWARTEKLNKICVNAFFPNEEAIKFYKRQGLKEYDLNLEMHI